MGQVEWLLSRNIIGVTLGNVQPQDCMAQGTETDMDTHADSLLPYCERDNMCSVVYTVGDQIMDDLITK